MASVTSERGATTLKYAPDSALLPTSRSRIILQKAQLENSYRYTVLEMFVQPMMRSSGVERIRNNFILS